tara:strand:- start:337 stop:636 length:300 start_codon:yes stop_codon:yes gene_type:complete
LKGIFTFWILAELQIAISPDKVQQQLKISQNHRKSSEFKALFSLSHGPPAKNTSFQLKFPNVLQSVLGWQFLNEITFSSISSQARAYFQHYLHQGFKTS